jgi:large subunit ribosomal protein L24
MKDFSKSWISSKKPNKQRKYRFKAPLHIRGEFLNIHLSKELRQKYHTRAVRVRVGDRVRIMRGQYRKQEGKIEEVNMKRLKVYVAKIEHVKRDGSKARYPLEPSNLMITELNTDDKKRFKTRKTAEPKARIEPKAKAEAKVKTEAKTAGPKPEIKTEHPVAAAKPKIAAK